MSLRFDYLENEDGSVNVLVVSEVENCSSMAGKLLLTREEWLTLRAALATANGLVEIESRMAGKPEPTFFGFVDKKPKPR